MGSRRRARLLVRLESFWMGHARKDLLGTRRHANSALATFSVLTERRHRAKRYVRTGSSSVENVSMDLNLIPSRVIRVRPGTFVRVSRSFRARAHVLWENSSLASVRLAHRVTPLSVPLAPLDGIAVMGLRGIAERLARTARKLKPNVQRAQRRMHSASNVGLVCTVRMAKSLLARPPASLVMSWRDFARPDRALTPPLAIWFLKVRMLSAALLFRARQRARQENCSRELVRQAVRQTLQHV